MLLHAPFTCTICQSSISCYVPGLVVVGRRTCAGSRATHAESRGRLMVCTLQPHQWWRRGAINPDSDIRPLGRRSNSRFFILPSIISQLARWTEVRSRAIDALKTWDGFLSRAAPKKGYMYNTQPAVQLSDLYLLVKFYRCTS